MAAQGPVGKPRSVLLVILLSIVTCGIWPIVWSYQNGEELKRYARDGLGGVAYLLITLFVSPVTMFLMANEVEKLYRHEGKEPPITTLWGLWFLLPVIGNIIWYVRIQNALNDFWVEHGAPNNPGL
jgi:4-amino-4-deoxy-L-arabinose transferase-like glycosyltransferase